MFYLSIYLSINLSIYFMSSLVEKVFFNLEYINLQNCNQGNYISRVSQQSRIQTGSLETIPGVLGTWIQVVWKLYQVSRNLDKGSLETLPVVQEPGYRQFELYQVSRNLDTGSLETLPGVQVVLDAGSLETIQGVQEPGYRQFGTYTRCLGTWIQVVWKLYQVSRNLQVVWKLYQMSWQSWIQVVWKLYQVSRQSWIQVVWKLYQVSRQSQIQVVLKLYQVSRQSWIRVVWKLYQVYRNLDTISLDTRLPSSPRYNSLNNSGYRQFRYQVSQYSWIQVSQQSCIHPV